MDENNPVTLSYFELDMKLSGFGLEIYFVINQLVKWKKIANMNEWPSIIVMMTSFVEMGSLTKIN